MGGTAFAERRRGVASLLGGGAGAFFALVILAVVAACTSAPFRNPQNALNILRQCSYSGIIALGMTLVIVTGCIDLSVGSMFAFCGVAAVTLVAKLPAGALSEPAVAWLTFAVAALCGALCGALNGALVTFGKLPPFIATLGTYSVFRSLALYIADSGNVTTSCAAITRFGSSYFLGLPTPAWAMLALTAVLGAALARTPFGKHALATGANERVARFAGIDTGRVRFIAFTVIGLLAGFSAFLFLGRLSTISSSNAGMLYELDAIASVIIGGTAMSGGRGNVFGTLVGVLVLGVVSNLLDLWSVNVALQGTVKGLVIILSVLIQRKRK